VKSQCAPFETDEFAERPLGVLDLRQDRPRLGEERPAGLGPRDAAPTRSNSLVSWRASSDAMA
jgi:hypothetical protein